MPGPLTFIAGLFMTGTGAMMKINETSQHNADIKREKEREKERATHNYPPKNPTVNVLGSYLPEGVPDGRFTRDLISFYKQEGNPSKTAGEYYNGHQLGRKNEASSVRKEVKDYFFTTEKIADELVTKTCAILKLEEMGFEVDPLDPHLYIDQERFEKIKEIILSRPVCEKYELAITAKNRQELNERLKEIDQSTKKPESDWYTECRWKPLIDSKFDPYWTLAWYVHKGYCDYDLTGKLGPLETENFRNGKWREGYWRD